jgi:hypothetical protein
MRAGIGATDLVRLYPAWWRRRYGVEITDLLGSQRGDFHDALDLLRGAVDAHLHPPRRSVMPVAASLATGGLWTATAIGAMAQVVPTDWPGFTLDLLPLAVAAAATMVVAVAGVAVRLGDPPARIRAGVALAVLAQIGLLVALVVAAGGGVYGGVTGGAESAAAVGIAAIGLFLVRRGELRVGSVVAVAGLSLFLAAPGNWLLCGAVWTAIGAVQLAERNRDRAISSLT